MFTEFKGQSRPVIETSNDMLTFIEQASAIFCDTCDLLFDLGGVKLGRKMKERNIPRIHSVFYRWLLMARITNRKRLKHWAFIQSIHNFNDSAIYWCHGGGERCCGGEGVFIHHSSSSVKPTVVVLGSFVREWAMANSGSTTYLLGNRREGKSFL